MEQQFPVVLSSVPSICDKKGNSSLDLFGSFLYADFYGYNYLADKNACRGIGCIHD